MKFLHIADLHIGKRVNGFSMIEDQRYILNQIIEIAESENVDALLIAGDVYDKQIPSTEAVTLFDEFLAIVAKKNIKTFIVSGNHDSAERVGFGAELMTMSGVYMSKPFYKKIEKVELEDAYGKLNIYFLPFIKPVIVKHSFPEEEITDYNQAMDVVMKHNEIDERERNILVAHQFVKGGSICDSEEFSVGGLDEVASEHFEKFDYVALGHLHGPQHIGKESIRYAGSPLKYSLSEENHEKSVTLINIEEKGHIEIKKTLLKPLRDMRKIQGTYMEVTKRSFYEGTNVNDYIHVVLKDEEDIPEALGKLRTIYPNIMSLSYDNKRTQNYENKVVATDVEEKTPLELFEELYEMQNNQGFNDEQKEFLSDLMEKIWNK